MAAPKRPFESPDRNRPLKRSFPGPRPDNYSISSGSVISRIEDPMPSEARFEVQEEGSSPHIDQDDELDPRFDELLSQVPAVPVVDPDKELRLMGKVGMLEKRLEDSNNRANAYRKVQEELLQKKNEEITGLKSEIERLKESLSSVEAFRENEIKRLKQVIDHDRMSVKKPKVDEDPCFFRMGDFFGEHLDSRFVDHDPDISPVYPRPD